MGGVSDQVTSLYRARQPAEKRLDDTLVKPHDSSLEKETLTRASLSFHSMTSPFTHNFQVTIYGSSHFQLSLSEFCGIWSKVFHLKINNTLIYGIWNYAGIWRYDGFWKSNAIRFRWDPDGSSPSFKLRFFFLGLFGNIVYDRPGLGGGSVNSCSPHIWGTVGDALTITNDCALEACLWIELLGTTTVFHPGKRL